MRLAEQTIFGPRQVIKVQVMDTFLYYAVNYSLTIDWSFVRDVFHQTGRKDGSRGSQYTDKPSQDDETEFEYEYGAACSSISTLLVAAVVVVLVALARSY